VRARWVVPVVRRAVWLVRGTSVSVRGRLGRVSGRDVD
jgi:hypothetical protein